MGREYAALPLEETIPIRVCNKCKIEKSLSDFPKDKYKRDGFSTQCKKCHREYCFIKKYGITIHQYDEILISQDSKCAICKRTQSDNSLHNLTGKPTFLPVDHCHATGKIRGILCSPCNVAIGLLQENVDICKSAVHYLTKNALK